LEKRAIGQPPGQSKTGEKKEMKIKRGLFEILAVATILTALVTTGCGRWKCFYEQPSVSPLGSQSDEVWKNQEANAEVSDFVVYQHEFQRDSEKLNTDGEDHVKQIADRLLRGQDAPVVVERSNTSVREDTVYGYPVHVNPELDMRRREIIVRSLTAMGISDADQRVVVAPAYVPGLRGPEAEAAYRRGMTSYNEGSFGGFFFGGGSGFGF
jgi:hypothetical protein